jgi:carbohydrate-binding DOMON domain-containing protein
MPDLSSLLNLPQFQGLVSLAQTNPALFNQLTNSSYFDVPATTATTEPFTAATPTLSYPGTPTSTPINSSTPTTAEDFESSLRCLASELGFEPDKYSDNAHLDYVNMDDFLNTYSK